MAAKVMLMSILNCARPVLFYNDDHAFPFSVSGTAFVVSFRDRLFVVTAKHVLRLREFTAEQFRVQYCPDGHEFIPTKALNSFTPTGAEDTDREDVVAWEVDYAQLHRNLFGRYEPYVLREEEAREPFRGASDYLYRGYPIEHRQIDFEGGHIGQNSVAGSARYLGPTPDLDGLHGLRFDHIEGLDNLDGLSGSPVFQTWRAEGKYSEARFAGILLRGARWPMRGHFLESRRVIELLAEIVEGRAEHVPYPPRV